ncbi:MAG: DUF423 domain-containing protein [Sulfobacillus sp.]
MASLFLAAGLLGFLGVALGAFGAHGLRAKLDEQHMATFQTGVQYQMYHALALGMVALTSSAITRSILLQWAGWCFIAGIAFFSGSLYILSLTGQRRWGLVTPLGGLLFLAGWTLWILAAWRLLMLH